MLMEHRKDSNWNAAAEMVDTHILRTSSPHEHALVPHWTSLKIHKFKDKIIKNFKMATAEY